MIISLLGYMGSGKTHISKILSEELGFSLIDLDTEISRKQHRSIAKIFEEKGEIFFRKAERETLEEILATNNSAVLSLGGGTPVYYNNMDVINNASISFYLRSSVKLLSERLLRNKQKRPMIARIEDSDLPEFIAKHLFERSGFYNRAQFIIDTDGKSPEEISAEIRSKISI